jgi:hypothetical protein
MNESKQHLKVVQAAAKLHDAEPDIGDLAKALDDIALNLELLHLHLGFVAFLMNARAVKDGVVPKEAMPAHYEERPVDLSEIVNAPGSAQGEVFTGSETP